MTKALLIALALHLPIFGYLAYGTLSGGEGIDRPEMIEEGRWSLEVLFLQDGPASTKEKRGAEVQLSAAPLPSSSDPAAEAVSVDNIGSDRPSATVYESQEPRAEDSRNPTEQASSGSSFPVGESSLDALHQTPSLPKILNSDLRPEYPRQALRRRLEGDILFVISISQDGLIEEYEVDSISDELFLQSAERYLMELRFDMQGRERKVFTGDFTVSYRLR
jgi:outer membrane biosynthesis protein TonB